MHGFRNTDNDTELLEECGVSVKHDGGQMTYLTLSLIDLQASSWDILL